ncbi:hypothetical protein HYPSUDRAFT_39015 [Hypholoma sublateritium FD-334 SS-4]|uniref:Uncharacterized protein n=1 Tax=Hypholoma sublateritium (strain FD-334 SS-4) TaxID=945553 RepID=A0A0D2P6J1_HYPSF|nr:hypothetical protein HYPSUDRAFT_39015 [Hypholoma sublateritium FD-334 SS-4]
MPRHTFHRALSGFRSSKKAASSAGDDAGDPEKAPQVQSIDQLLALDELPRTNHESVGPGKGAGLNSPILGRQPSLQAPLSPDTLNSSKVGIEKLRYLISRSPSLSNAVQILVVSQPDAELIASGWISDDSTFTISLSQFETLLADAESSHKHHETTDKLVKTRAKLDLLVAENKRLHDIADLANSEAARVRSVLEETKLQFSSFMRKRFGLSQHAHRLDEENKTFRDKLANVNQKHKIFHESATKKLQENLDAVRLELEGYVSKHEKTLSQLRDSETLTATLTKKLDDSDRHCGRLRLNLTKAESKITHLTTEKAKSDELTEKHRKFSVALHQEVRPLREEQKKLQERVSELDTALSSRLSALGKLRADFNSLKEEKRVWQGRMDTLRYTTISAERRVRMLNHIAASKLDPKTGADSQSRIRRGNNTKPQTPSQEALQAIERLNKMISDVASLIVPFFLGSPPTQGWSPNIKRCKMVFGHWVTSTLLRRCAMLKSGYDHPWFLHSVIQMFLVDWCRAIIEAWYPKQQSFSELLMSQLVGSYHGKRSEGSKMPFQLVQMVSNGTVPPDLRTWSQEILDDLLQILPTPEWGLNSDYGLKTILPKIANLCQISYDIRLALAEEDICGNIQLLVYPSDTQFQQETMNSAEAPPEASGLEIDEGGDIAGTVGIGLRESVVKKSSQGISELAFNTLLAPDVILARHLQAALKLDGINLTSNNPVFLSSAESMQGVWDHDNFWGQDAPSS